MATLRARFTDDLKTAMKAGEKLKVDTIRLIGAKLKEADINARAAGKTEAAEGDLLAMMQNMIKQRQESAKIFRDNNRPELADKEEGEIAVITGYLPAQLSEAEITQAVTAAIAESGAASAKDMGKVMAVLKEKYTGQVDMARLSPLVKQKLAG